MKRMTMLLTMLCVAGNCLAADYWRKSATDYPFPVVLVDVTDGYSAETEKKAADTTITVTDLTDGNTPGAFTDDATSWKEVGDGTGEYRLLIGAEEFDETDSDYLVKIVVSGCRTVRFVVHTLVGTPGNMATTDDGGTINVASGVVEADAVKLGGTAQSATDLKDFADTGYDPSTHYAQVNLVTAEGNDVTDPNGLLKVVVHDTSEASSPLTSAYDTVEAAMAAMLDAAISGSPTAGSINERIKTLDDAYTATRAAYLDNVNNAALATTVAQTGDAYDSLTDAQTILDKLDAMLVLDGAVYQWTTNALELAPTGSGTTTSPWATTPSSDPNFVDPTTAGYLLLNTYKLLNGKL